MEKFRFILLPACWMLAAHGFGAPDLPAAGADFTESPVPATSSDLMQREIDRRREVNFRLNEILDLADRLYQSGEWDHAEAKYSLVLQEANAQGGTQGFYRRAQVGKAKCMAANALAKEESGDYAEAAGLIRQALDLDPQNKALARHAEILQEKSSRSADPFAGNAAVTPDLLEKTVEIRKLLSLADQLTETGQYLKARRKLDDVLRLDPYNRVARKKIEDLEEKRLQLANERYAASREKALAKVSEAWMAPPPARIEPGKTRQTGSATESGSAALLRKLAEIRIPELTFNERPIRAAVEEIQRLSQEYDPEKKRVKFCAEASTAGGWSGSGVGHSESGTAGHSLADRSQIFVRTNPGR